MYGKSVYYHEVMYFQHAPPHATALEISADRMPKSPFAGAQPWQHSVYYYWWLFLRENEEYIQCCHQGGKGALEWLYNDFGDVRPANFVEWWISGGRELFCEPKHLEVLPINRYRFRDLAKQVNDKARERNSAPESLYLEIPLAGMSEERMIEEVRSIWRKVSIENQVPKDSHALYPVFSKPVLYTLHRRLMLLRLAKQNFGNLIEIGWEAGILTKADAVRSDETKRQKVSRQLRYARCLAEHTGYGLFPCHRPCKLEGGMQQFMAERNLKNKRRRKEFEEWRRDGRRELKIKNEKEQYARIIRLAHEGVDVVKY